MMEDEKTSPAETPPATVSDSIKERLFKARTLIISGEITQRLRQEPS